MVGGCVAEGIGERLRNGMDASRPTQTLATGRGRFAWLKDMDPFRV